MSQAQDANSGATFSVKIGINPISWSNDDLPSLGGETPLEVALTEGKAIGYQGFELGNKFPRQSAALRARRRRKFVRSERTWSYLPTTAPK